MSTRWQLLQPILSTTGVQTDVNTLAIAHHSTLHSAHVVRPLTVVSIRLRILHSVLAPIQSEVP